MASQDLWLRRRDLVLLYVNALQFAGPLSVFNSGPLCCSVPLTLQINKKAKGEIQMRKLAQDICSMYCMYNIDIVYYVQKNHIKDSPRYVPSLTTADKQKLIY